MSHKSLSPESIAEMICTHWMNENKFNTQISNHEFRTSLLEKDCVDLEGKLCLPLARNREIQCSAFIKGKLSWKWSTVLGRTEKRCTDMNICLENTDLMVSNKEFLAPSLDIQYNEDSRGNPAIKSWKVREKESEKSKICSIFPVEPQFLKWLSGVSCQLRIDLMTVRFEDRLVNKNMLSSFFSALNSFLFGLPFEKVNLGNQFNSEEHLYSIHIKTINIMHDCSDGKSLRCQIHNFSSDGRRWSVEKATLSIPFLIYQVKLNAIKIFGEVKGSYLKASVKTLNMLQIEDRQTKISLKMAVLDCLLESDIGGLKIQFSSQVALEKQLINRPVKTLSSAALPFPVQLIAFCGITVTQEKKEIATFQNLSLLLQPVHPFRSTVAIFFNADQMSFGGCLKLNSASCQCSVDVLTSFSDNFAVTIDSASFETSDRTITWLQTVMENAQLACAPIKLPFAKISNIKVGLFCNGATTNTNSDVIELTSIDGEEETTSSSLIISFGSRLLEEVEQRRELWKDRRAEVADSVAIAAGNALLGTSMVTPVGPLVALGSLSIRDQVGTAVTAGKQARGASEYERYRFGDFSRGITRQLSHSSNESNQNESIKNPVLKDKRRLAGVGGMSAGAIAGSVVLGPVGLIAGSAVGSQLAKASVGKNKAGEIEEDAEMRKSDIFTNIENRQHEHKNNNCEWWEESQQKQEQRQQFHSTPVQTASRSTNTNKIYEGESAKFCQSIPQQQEGYRFGDFTRGIIARGKKADGRNEESGYKFGDFTRGLFG